MSHGHLTFGDGAFQVEVSWVLEDLRRRLESVNQVKNMRDSNRFKPGGFDSQMTHGCLERGLSHTCPVLGSHS